MRKGADCLSKWVGESERQLRLLFDQASERANRVIGPSEVDGIISGISIVLDLVHFEDN